jgi:DNA-directed RNA polymerase subunit RPC12/RpoP
MSVKGKSLSISAPNIFGMLDIFSYRKWSLKFKCGNCQAEPIVQHDEIKNYHKCPICGEINILKETSWYDL